MDIFDELSPISQKTGSSSSGNNSNYNGNNGKELQASKELIELFSEQGLNENGIKELLEVLLANNISSVNDLSMFPLDKLPSLKLKPKARSVLKVIIPKLNGCFLILEFSFY